MGAYISVFICGFFEDFFGELTLFKSKFGTAAFKVIR